MSNRLFQGVVHQMKDAMDRVIGVMDENYTIIACSELLRIGESQEFETFPVISGNEAFVSGHFTYKPFGTPQHPEYTLFVEGNDPQAAKYCAILAVALSNIKHYYDEKYDRSNFIKNVILDNILPGDIYIKSRELHFNSEVSRVVLLIRVVTQNDVSVYDVIQNLFPDKTKDFVINISENDLVLVKEVRPNVELKDLVKIAKTIEDTLGTELMVKTTIGIGTVAMQLKNIVTSFKEAQLAIEVGQVFDTEKTIISFENLGVGRLIYQLPTTMCEQFLSEVFRKGSISALDHETLFTIQKFFENNLNVSETSRKLFVHRNTLVYRLEKIKKITGLDLREFDHAIIFKVALMVRKYLNSREIKQ